MFKTRTLTSVLAGSALAVAAAVGTAAPASAHPEITRLACDVGAGQVFCIVFHTGTATPRTTRWTVNGAPIIGADDQDSMGTTCRLNEKVSIRVTITDQFGSDSLGIVRKCGAIIP
jgi:hypothetical protein